MTLDDWRHLSWIVGAVGQTAFVLLYAVVPWWRDYVGRALFFKSLGLMVLLDVTVIDILIDYAAEDAVTVGLYWLVVVGICWQLGALVRQRFFRR